MRCSQLPSQAANGHGYNPYLGGMCQLSYITHVKRNQAKQEIKISNQLFNFKCTNC